MNTLNFTDNTITVNGTEFKVDYPVLDAFELAGIVVVLMDPDTYLGDPNYKAKRRMGANAFKNLQAFTLQGSKLWEAQFPESSDYYYKISSKNPLVLYAFSSFKCEIDITSGTIKSKEFLK